MLFHCSSHVPLFCGILIDLPVFHCSASVPVFHQCSAGVPCFVALCFGVPGFIVCQKIMLRILYLIRKKHMHIPLNKFFIPLNIFVTTLRGRDYVKF